MADWTTITDTQVDPDAPLTSGLGYAWRDNPIAIADGASGAPLVQPRAMDSFVGRAVLPNDATPEVITGLDPETVLHFVGSYANGTGDIAVLQISGSSDGGATWGGWVNIAGSTVVGSYSIAAILNLKNGVFDSTNGTSDIGGNINAIRFRHSSTLFGSGAMVGRLSIMALAKSP